MNDAHESSPEEWPPAVRAVLDGADSYDTLSQAEQVVVREEWNRRIKARRASLDLEARFLAEGGTWVEADDDGNVIFKGVDETGKVVRLSREARERRATE